MHVLRPPITYDILRIAYTRTNDNNTHRQQIESAIEILAAAKQLKLTRKTYAWIVAQSVIGANDNERAPSEFQPGILGKSRK